MWHRLDKRTMLNGSTTSYLFKSDGTMHIIGQSLLLGRVGDHRQSYPYRYVGQGVWRVIGTDITLRISQDKLLFRLPIPQFNDFILYVFERK